MRAVQENPTREKLGLQTALSRCSQQDKKVELQAGGLHSLPLENLLGAVDEALF